MPSDINYPDSFDNNDTLYLEVNSLRTQLTSNITASDTTIPVVTASVFPDNGFISILTGSDITRTAAITYSGTNSTEFLNAERGVDNTEAFPHFAGNNVDLTVVSRHHNNLKDAVIALEQFIGASGSENFLPVDDQGNVTISGNVFGDVTGTFSVCDDLDLKGDGTVSGTISVGALPPTSIGASSSCRDEGESAGTANPSASTGCTVGPLVVGENLTLYRINVAV